MGVITQGKSMLQNKTKKNIAGVMDLWVNHFCSGWSLDSETLSTSRLQSPGSSPSGNIDTAIFSPGVGAQSVDLGSETLCLGLWGGFSVDIPSEALEVYYCS